MTAALYPNETETEVREFLEKSISSDREEIFLAIEAGEAVGFVLVSLRYEYVEGSKSSPVGYVEAIYVKEKHRKGGVARKLYLLTEDWASKHGCKEMGSDTWDWNKAAINFHKQLGFKQEDVLVHFIKDIEKDSD